MPYYNLIETEDYPALMIDGILMHRIKETTPKKDAELKIKILNISGGRVLDTCTGLGYTAICASKYADELFTVEKDEGVIAMGKNNPYSNELFTSSKIKLIHGDVLEEVRKFSDEYFDYIIHDPPRFALAGMLYGQDFYSSLYRVLRKNGKIFHYIGSPGKRFRNKEIQKGVINRLRNAGFSVEINEEAQGVIGIKKVLLSPGILLKFKI